MTTMQQEDDPPLLRLPPELLLDICDLLPLASHLVFRLQVCRRLRYHREIGPLHLPPRLSFAHWQQASEELKLIGLARNDDDVEDDDEDEEEAERWCGAEGSHWAGAPPQLRNHERRFPKQPPRVKPALPTVPAERLASGSSAPGWTGASNLAPKAYNLEVALGALLATGPASEVRLFRRILAFVGLLPPERALPPKGALRSPEKRRSMRLPVALEDTLQPGWARGAEEIAAPRSEQRLKTICAISWSGISGQSLVHLLTTEASFADVDLVVKTERFDQDSWKSFNDPLASQRQQRQYPIRIIDEGDYSAGRVTTMPCSSRSAPSPCSYVETQVSVHIGSKASEEKGRTMKGKGLFAGYRAMCFNAESARKRASASASPLNNGDVQKDEDGDGESDASTSAAASSRPRIRPLHVVFVGRFRLDDALETEEMLSLSAMRCSACQQALAL